MSIPNLPPAPPALLARAICALERYRYRFNGEVQLHAGIAQALSAEGIAFEHEKRPSASCRYDFWCPEGSIVIEAKIHGSYAAALRQVERYLQLPDCLAVIIAATKVWAADAKPQELHGKPVLFARLRAQVF
jgi:hypothetical protein